MYSTWGNLPTELLFNIFDALSFDDITNCCCVCLHWQRVALMQRYHNVVISNPTQLKKFARTISTSTSSPGQYICDLYVRGNFEEELKAPKYSKDGEPLDTFSQIVKYAPHLEALMLGSTSNLFWERMAKETSQGNLSKLNFFQHPRNENEFDNYHKAIMNLTKTMKDIAIFDTRAFNLKGCELLLSRLSECERLQLLTIRWNTRMPLATLDNVIDTLPTLQFFTLDVDSIGEPSTFEDHDDSLLLKQHTALCQLNLTALFDSEKAFLYIMKKFPRLESLKVKTLTDAIITTAFSDDTLELLTNYISKLAEFSFKRIQFTNIVDLIVKVSDQVKNPRISADLWLYRPDHFFKNVCVQIEHDKEQEISKKINFEIERATLPMFFRQLAERIHHLNLDCSTENEVFITSDTELALSEDALSIDFGDIITSCPELSTVVVNDGIFFDMNSEGTQSNSITSMVFKTCECFGEFLTSLSYRLPKLNRVEFKHIILCYSANDIAEEYPPSVMRFHMPQTSFDMFSIKDSSLIENSDFLYLQVTTVSGVRQYRLSQAEASLISSEEYAAAREDADSVVCIEITCRGLQQVEFYDSSRLIQISHCLEQ